MRVIHYIALAGTSALALTGPAFAQDAQEDAPAGDDAREIVVTGTLIRGIAPGGAQTIGVDQEKIAATGAVNTSELITSIPQAGSFLGFLGVRGDRNFSLMVNRPTLRYLGNTSSSTNSTLVLIDGHRLPGMGIQQSSADLDAIAASAIERVEVVTDGGSSTYGSDAVGGVMNFITRKRFDGVEVKGSVGFADNYDAYNANIIAGHTWGGLSAYITYDYARHDSLLGGDRDWSQSRDWVNGVGADSACAVGNVRATVGGVTTTYALPGLTAGLGNRCDNTQFATLYPAEVKHTVFGRLNYDAGGPVSLSLQAYYVNRRNESSTGPLAANGVAMPNTSPYFINLPGAPTTEQFLFNFSPVFGNATRATSTLEAYGITPSLKWNIGRDWQLNAFYNFGIGKAGFIGDLINLAPINAATTAGTFNPVDLAAATNAATLAAARDWFQYGRGTHTMHNARLVMDGPLFGLPGGDVRAAIGAEYLYEKIEAAFSRGATAAQVAALTDRIASRNVKSIFGEVNLPLLGEDSGIHSLSVTASGRYDHYSDFGSTFNPKIGVNFAPVAWLSLRGNWGKAFQAPGISTISEGASPSFTALTIATRPYVNPSLPVGAKTHIVTFGGTKMPLQPQKATTWSLGFDISRPELAGLNAGLTYYNIDFQGAIGQVPIFSPNIFYPQFPDNYVTYDDPAAMQAFYDRFAAEATNASTFLAQLPNGDLSAVYAVFDSRTQNLARVQTAGLDFYVRGRQQTGFGDIFAEISGNYILKYKQQPNPAAPLVSTLEADTTRLRLTATVGANVGALRAQATWNHSQGYDITPTVLNLQQNHVGSFNVFNLFFQYKVPGDSAIARDLAFTLNIDNVFDQSPPLYRGAGNSLFGVANGFTIGRFVRLGVSKAF